MKVLLCIFSVLLRPRLAFLDTTLAANANLRTAIPLHLLQTVAAGADEQTEEIDLRKLFDRDVDLLRRTLRTLLLVSAE